MFDALSDRFDGIFKRLRGKGRLTEDDVDEVLREIRVALLEADVALPVAKGFVQRVKEQCLAADLHNALSPAQQVIKIVHEELKSTLGGETLKITYASKPPTVVLMAGLQGSGKTTATGKLARWFKQNGRNPLVVGADLQRPAAVDQLRTIAGQVGVSMFSDDEAARSGSGDPVDVARRGVEEAVDKGRDVVIVDTAGRLAIDAELMEQVRQISEATQPHYTFLVVDAMTGQDAVTVAEEFDKALALDGVILSKLDGDARGGAALSVKDIVGKPIVFASTGEKPADFEQFHPDRMADRILGMGDVLTLIEKVEQEYDQEVAQRAQEALLEGQFTLDDFLEQMQQIRKMGPLNSIIGMLPGVPKELKNAEIGEKELGRVEAVIRSMTTEERRQPKIIDGSRRARIAKGSGTSVSEVNLLLQQFDQMSKMMKRFGGTAGGGKKKGKNKKGKGPGRVTAAKAAAKALPDLRQLQELQQGGTVPDLDELLGTTRRDKQWP